MFDTSLTPRARSSRLFLLLISLIAAGAFPASAVGQITWSGGTGNWSDVNNWSPNPCAPNPPCYPNNNSPLPDVAIDGGKNDISPVTMDVHAIIENLTIDSDDSLSLNDNVNLQINGATIDNAGKITVNSSNGGNGLTVTSNATLSGGGTVTLAGGKIEGQAQLTNQETIDGAGFITTIFTNQSLIDANAVSPLAIVVGAATVTNTGTLEASGGGILQFTGGAVNNAGGTIKALDGSSVQLNGQINGGTLTTSGTGVIHGVANGPVLNGVTNSGTYQVPPSSTTLLGTITNTAAIQVNSTAAATSQLLMSGTVTLMGSGTVTLTDQPRNSVLGTLINQNNTISGAGTMGQGTLTNAGVINATSANHNHLLISYSGNLVTNTGTMEASSGGTLDVQTANVTNTGGTIQALAGTGTSAGGTVLLTGLTVTGGALKTSGTGVNTGVIISTNSTFNGLANAGTVQVKDNTQTFLEGTIDNTGLIQLLSTSQGSNLRIIGNVTLSGNGKIAMLNNTFLYGASTGNEILTSQNTIHGSGNIGKNFMGLVNKGSIVANGTIPLTIQPGSKAFNNIGTLSVARGSILDVTGGPFLNFSGTTLTGGAYQVTGTLQFDGAHIVTNAASITLTGTLSKIIDQASNNALAGFATNAAKGSFTLAGNQSLTTPAAFSNAGTFLVSKGSTFAGTGGNYTQTGGRTTVDGTLRSSPAGAINIQGGSVFGNGGILAATVNSSGIFNVGDFLKKAGSLSITGNYTQNAAGVLNIDIGGTTAGTTFDQLNISAGANLSGTLNIGLINAFVPAIGSTFPILNCSSRTGQFSILNGTSINGSEHFTVSYNSTGVVLTVVAGA